MTCELKEEHRVLSVHLQCHAAVRLPLPPWEWSYKHYPLWSLYAACVCTDSIYLLLSVYFSVLLLFVSTLCKDIYCMFVHPGWGGGSSSSFFSPPDEGSFLGRRKESLRINVVACCTDCKALWGKNCHKWFWAINITDLTIIFRPIRDPWGRCWHRYQEDKMWYISAAMHTLSQRSLTYGF